MNPREELQAIQNQIDTLNHRKGPIVEAWEGEKRRQGDPGIEKPPELKAINGQLFFLYGQRDAILRDHPRLQQEFGPRTGMKNTKPTSWVPTPSALSSADRAKRKKNIHPDFKAWCAAERPQVKCSLENWEDAAIRGRFQAHLDAEQSRREAEHSARVEAAREREKAEEPEGVARQATEKRAAIEAQYGPIIDDFRSCMEYFGLRYRDEMDLLAMVKSRDHWEYYQMWLDAGRPAAA